MSTDPRKAPESGFDSGDGSPSEAASRIASDVDATSATLGDGPAGAALASEAEEQEPGATEPKAGADLGSTEPEAGADLGSTEPQPVDLDALSAKAQQADEYLALAQRTKADFENYRKRAAREAAAAQQRGVAKLARELLPAVDNLDRALAAIGSAAPAGVGQALTNGDGTLASGIKLVHADVIAALARVGIEPFSPVGERFDPQCHEAVAQQAFEGAEPGTVVEVYQRGYRIGDSVLRPARVLVAG
jgi:molecular chaperone GrpE